MTMRLCILLGVVCVAAGQCTVSSMAGYPCMKTDGSVTIHYKLAADEATAVLAIEATTAGYAALGVGTGMVGSKIVLGYVGTAAFVKAYAATDKSGVTEDASATWMSSPEVTEANGKTTTSFTCVIADVPGTTTAMSLVWSTSPQDAVVMHSAKSASPVTINLSEAKVTTPAPATVAPPTPAPATAQPAVGTTVAPPTPAPATIAPTLAPTTIAPTVAPPTAAPTSAPATAAPTVAPPTIVPTTAPTNAPTATPSGCASSTLEITSGVTYDCMKAVEGSVVTLHWTKQANGARKFALTSTAAGYIGIAFPTAEGKLGQMTPADALIYSAAALKYAIVVKAPSFSVNPDTTVLNTITDVAGAAVNGMKVLSWVDTATVDALAFNYAYHTSDTLEYHTKRGSTTIALSLDATATTAPATTAPTAAPVTPTPSSQCTASDTAMLPNIMYDCMVPLAGTSEVFLHWSLQSNGTRRFALKSKAGGYIAIAFPDTPGAMTPAKALIYSSAGALQYSLNSKSDVAVDANALPKVTGLVGSTVGGVRMFAWTDTTGTTTSRGGVTLQAAADVMQFTYAYHSSNFAVTQHTSKYAAAVNLKTATSTAEAVTDNKDKVRLHGAFQLAVWGYMVPLAVMAKRFGPLATQAKAGPYPVPFVVHAVMMGIGVILCISMVILALTTFESGTEDAHKELGIVVMSASILQVLMQVAKPPAESHSRFHFRIVHAGLGMVTLILATVTVFTGASNYDRIYANDEDFGKNVRIATIVPLAVFFLASIGLSFLKAKTAQVPSFSDNHKAEQPLNETESEMGPQWNM